MENQNRYLLSCYYQKYFIVLQWDNMILGRSYLSDLPWCSNFVILSFIRCFPEEYAQDSVRQIVNNNKRTIPTNNLCFADVCGNGSKDFKYSILNMHKNGASEKKWWICGHRKGLINWDLFPIFYIKHQRIEKRTPSSVKSWDRVWQAVFLETWKPNSEMQCLSNTEDLQWLQ